MMKAQNWKVTVSENLNMHVFDLDKLSEHELISHCTEWDLCTLVTLWPAIVAA